MINNVHYNALMTLTTAVGAEYIKAQIEAGVIELDQAREYLDGMKRVRTRDARAAEIETEMNSIMRHPSQRGGGSLPRLLELRSELTELWHAGQDDLQLLMRLVSELSENLPETRSGVES